MTESNITCSKDGHNVPVCNIKNWRASVRQNLAAGTADILEL